MNDEIDEILGNLCDAGCRINGDKADGFGDYHTCELPDAKAKMQALIKQARIDEVIRLSRYSKSEIPDPVLNKRTKKRIAELESKDER